MKKPNVSAGWREVIEGYVPQDEREAEERRIILELMDREGDRLLQRGCAYAHLTASSIIVNPGRTATLMAFHRIYHSWAWTGGHADGEPSPEALARREAEEVLLSCKACLCPLETFGPMNEGNRRLRDLAAEKGLLIPPDKLDKLK